LKRPCDCVFNTDLWLGRVHVMIKTRDKSNYGSSQRKGFIFCYYLNGRVVPPRCIQRRVRESTMSEPFFYLFFIARPVTRIRTRNNGLRFVVISTDYPRVGHLTKEERNNVLSLLLLLLLMATRCQSSGNWDEPVHIHTSYARHSGDVEFCFQFLPSAGRGYNKQCARVYIIIIHNNII